MWSDVLVPLEEHTVDRQIVYTCVHTSVPTVYTLMYTRVYKSVQACTLLALLPRAYPGEVL